MARAGFDLHLQALQGDLLVLGSMVEKAIAKALDALKRRDLEASQKMVEEDDLIDQKRFEIEREVRRAYGYPAAPGWRSEAIDRLPSHSGRAGAHGGLRRRHWQDQSNDGR